MLLAVFSQLESMGKQFEHLALGKVATEEREARAVEEVGELLGHDARQLDALDVELDAGQHGATELREQRARCDLDVPSWPDVAARAVGPAELRGVSLEDLAEQTWNNAVGLFGAPASLAAAPDARPIQGKPGQ